MNRGASILGGLCAACCGACESASVSVDGVYGVVEPKDVTIYNTGADDVELDDYQQTDVLLRIGAADPEGFYEGWGEVGYRGVRVTLPEGPGEFEGLAWGAGLAGRRIYGLQEADSTLLVPYRIVIDWGRSWSDDQPTPGVQYDAVGARTATFELGVGVEIDRFTFAVGGTVQFLDGRFDTTVTESQGEVAQRFEFTGVNLGPYLAVGLLAREDSLVNLELRVSGGNLRAFTFVLGYGY